MAATTEEMTTKGPIPTMSSILIAEACHRERPRTSLGLSGVDMGFNDMEPVLQRLFHAKEAKIFAKDAKKLNTITYMADSVNVIIQFFSQIILSALCGFSRCALCMKQSPAMNTNSIRPRFVIDDFQAVEQGLGLCDSGIIVEGEIPEFLVIALVHIHLGSSLRFMLGQLPVGNDLIIEPVVKSERRCPVERKNGRIPFHPGDR